MLGSHKKKKKSKIHDLIQQYLHCDGVPIQMLHQ